MAEAGKPASSSNEPFVPRSDRPELSPDARLADLTVRDLLGILQTSGTTLNPASAGYNRLGDFLKSHLSKFELKYDFWKWEHPKIELWKVEHPEIPVGQFPGGPDPRFAEIAQGIAGLTAQVHKLSSEVAELRRTGQR
jgi:hypothetical protein